MTNIKRDHCAPQNPADGLVSSTQWDELQAIFELSDRELSVARLLFEDRSREQIALMLRKDDGEPISPETVRVYADRLFRKLHVTSTTQMVLRVVRSLSLAGEVTRALGVSHNS